MNIYGSICLNLASGTTPRVLPQFRGKNVQSFKHTNHAYRGMVEIVHSDEADLCEVHLPQRSKSIQVLMEARDPDFRSRAVAHLVDRLPRMEAEYASARLLYKLNQYQKELKNLPASSAFVATLLNNTGTRHVAIMSQWWDLHVYGMYDSVNSCVRLVWTDDDYMITDIRAAEPGRYVFYRLPDLVDRPLFLYTNALCSKWHTWAKNFGPSPDSVLKCFNSLELFLYKEAELPTLNPQNENGSSA